MSFTPPSRNTADDIGRALFLAMITGILLGSFTVALSLLKNDAFRSTYVIIVPLAFYSLGTTAMVLASFLSVLFVVGTNMRERLFPKKGIRGFTEDFLSEHRQEADRLHAEMLRQKHDSPERPGRERSGL